MTPAPQPAVYAIDSSSLMDWYARYYPPDVFSGVLQRIEDMIAAGRLLAPELVQEEIHAVGPAGLNDWLNTKPQMIVATGQVLQAALGIKAQFAGLTDPKAAYEEADAYVIALAQLRNGTVITNETAASEKNKPKRTHYIPDVCRELGVPCIGFLGLLRREGWKF